MERRHKWQAILACSVFMLLDLKVGFGDAWALDSSCPSSVSTGQVACGTSNDVGSSSPSALKTKHLGNPVDIASGNKYQSEADVRLADSYLSLLRHYNSVHSDINIGLGNGWRHSYSVMLSKAGDSSLQIVQSDGRRVTFNNSENSFVAVDAGDGFVSAQPAGRYVWSLPDGRRFLFVGSFLVSIALDDEELILNYRNSRLHKVTDQDGRELIFEYAEGSLGLPSYTQTDAYVPPGHLAAVLLPDNLRVEYEYDRFQNLISVSYPRGSIRSLARNYSYEDELNSAFLTQRSNALDVPLARWTYDDHGRVSSYRSGWNIRADGSNRGPPDLQFRYSQGLKPARGITTVENRKGEIQKFDWVVGAGNTVIEVTPIETGNKQKFNDSETDDLRLDEVRSIVDLIDDSDEVRVLDIDGLGYPALVSYLHAKTRLSHELEISYSQSGGLIDVVWLKATDAVSNEPILETYDNVGLELSEEQGSVGELPRLTSLDIALSVEKTVLYLESANRALSQGSIITATDLDSAWGSSIRREEHDSSRRGFKSGGNPSVSNVCSAPLFDCATLAQISEYAELAQCVYLTTPCDSGLFEVDLAALGVSIDDLNGRSFRAEIYYDSDNREYVVAFAGTHSSASGILNAMGDWNSNVRQELGVSSHQYEQAVILARTLIALNPGESFRFTGHSLGGGLATAAAAAVNQEAYVFNPSALTPESSLNLAILYSNAQANTQIFSVDGEVLNHYQSSLSSMHFPPGTFNVLPQPNQVWIQSQLSPTPTATFSDRVRNLVHGISAVRQSLEDLAIRNQCIP